MASGSLATMAEPLNGMNMSRGLLDIASPAGEGLLLYLWATRACLHYSIVSRLLIIIYQPGLRTEETSLGVKFYLFISSRTSLSGSVAALLGCRDSGRTPYLANRHYCGLNSECGLISVGSVVCVG